MAFEPIRAIDLPVLRTARTVSTGTVSETPLGVPVPALKCFESGNQCLGRRDYPGAIRAFLDTLSMVPRFPEAHYNLGLANQLLNRTGPAMTCYRTALALNRDLPQAANKLGRLLLNQGRLPEAERFLRQAIRLAPGFAEAHFNLGDFFCTRKQIDEAVPAYRQAVDIDPAMAEAWNNLGNVLRLQGKHLEACECYRRVIRLRPELAEAHFNLGSALKDADEAEPAVEALRRALELRPGYAEAWNNLGLSHKGRGEYRRSIECYAQALRFKPHLAEAYWNRAHSLLMLGCFEKGFEDFEKRFALPHWRNIYPHRMVLPRWDGRPNRRCRVLVHDEQGLGDTLQFVRYLPMVRERCARVILETQEPLVDLIRGIPGVDEVVARPAGIPRDAEVDCYAPLMSLPRIFGTRLESVPAVVPYLWADPLKANQWKTRLGDSPFKVGIVWAGRPEHQNDKNRSCRLEFFAPIARSPGVRLFSLQKGAAVSQIAESGLGQAITSLGPELTDFTDTAAAVSRLDLVISVDTSVAHLAGAMARPVWVLLPTISDWRWMLDREDSPWYPTMRLFRQSQRGDWGDVIGRIAQEIRQMVPDGFMTGV